MGSWRSWGRGGHGGRLTLSAFHCTTSSLWPGLGCHGSNVGDGGAAVGGGSVAGGGVARRIWSHRSPSKPSLHSQAKAGSPTPSLRLQLPWRHGPPAHGSVKNWRTETGRHRHQMVATATVAREVLTIGSVVRANVW
ncbi:hypothetical protein EYF80_066739 [Liparis tanakae]|uniref:Uncharacterized protein n=1 Tax=Liparis tanakae TaxID=230148 RepID=A0A4Z2E464_9TELE|nr:hypothetical protein EYF80_066739 [Liparis tanakae]